MPDNVVSFEEACRDRQLAVIAKAWAAMPEAQRAVASGWKHRMRGGWEKRA